MSSSIVGETNTKNTNLRGEGSLKTREHATVITDYDQDELQSRMERIKKHSTSYFYLLCGLIASGIFGKMQKLANQKYVQSVIHGEPADLATVDLFSNLVSAIAPLLGYLVDNIYPFRRRFSLYLIVAGVIASASLVFVGTFSQSKASFIAAISIHASAGSFMSVVTQGVIALKTKMDVTVFDMKEQIEGMKGSQEQEKGRSVSHVDGSAPKVVVSRDRIGIRLYTFYTVFSSFFEGISSIIGGFIVEYVPIKVVYLIASSTGILLVLFIIFYVKEPKEEKMFSERKDLLVTIKNFFKVFFAPLVILPAILKLLTNAIPDPGDAISFILVNQGGWTYAQLGEVNALAVPIVAYAVFKLSKFRKASSFQVLFLAGILSFGWSQLVEIPLIFTNIPVLLFLVCYFLVVILSFISELFTTTSLFGRFNALIPDGFESTGANILNSLVDLAGALSLYGTKRELDYYGVVNGYYSRIKGPLIINFALSIITCFICPFFLLGGAKSQSKRTN